MCDPININILRESDVNETRTQAVIFEGKEDQLKDGFILQDPDIILSPSCQGPLATPFETFCFVPGVSQFDAGMCNINFQSENPNAYFERIIRGDVSHPDQLKSIFESSTLPMPQPTSWIRVQDNFTFLQVSPASEDYLGLGRIGNDIGIASANTCQCLLVTMNGYLFVNQDDGLMRRITFTVDEKTPPTFVSGNNDVIQTPYVNGVGNVRAAVFSNKFYLFLNDTWREQTNTVDIAVRYQAAKLWEVPILSDTYVAVFFVALNKWGVDVYKMNATLSEEQMRVPIARFGQTLVSVPDVRSGIFVLTPDDKFLIVSTFNGSLSTTPMFLHSINIETLQAQYVRWIINPVGFLYPFLVDFAPYYTSAICDGDIVNTSSTAQVLSQFGSSLTIRFTLNASSGIVSDLVVLKNNVLTSTHFAENVNHLKRLYVMDNALRTTRDITAAFTTLNQPFILNSTTESYNFAISPDGFDTWIFRDGRLYRLRSTNGTSWQPGLTWTNDFNLYSALFIKMSDLGLPGFDQAIYNPGAAWYLGTLTTAHEFPLATTFPIECARSKHNAFRLVLREPPENKINGLITFKFAAGELQRAAEYWIAAEANSIRLYNDSNVVFIGEDETEDFLWESHTHDRASFLAVDGSSYHEMELKTAPFAVTSPNGLYLLYVTGNNTNRMRLVYNVFNSERLALWCAQDTERFGKALDMQSNFCWNALKASGADFVDTRCSCVGGDRLFNIIAPNAHLVPRGLLGPLQENLPCIADGCTTGALHEGDTVTNIRNYVAARCSGRLFHTCLEALSLATGNTLINTDFLVLQHCSTNANVQCTSNESCGPGFVCENGVCVTECASNEQCEQFYGSFNFSCVQGRCQLKPRVHKNKIQTTVIIAIIVGVALLAMVLLFVVLLAKQNKRNKKR